MAENAPKKVVYESKEALYAKAVQKMEADQYIVQAAYRVENFRVAASMFEELGDYQDAPGLAMRCRDLADEAEEKGKEVSYQRCVRRLKKKNQKQSILEKVNVELTALGDYKDAPELLENVQQQISISERKKNLKSRIKLLIGAVIIAALFIGYNSGFFYYLEGIAFDRMGQYKEAEKVFSSLQGFLNSDDYVLLEQRRYLENAKEGNEVNFGKYKWKVLRREGSILTLLTSAIGSDHDFYSVKYNETLEDVTWKDCTLRAWLNGEIYQNSFSDMERARIQVQISGYSENSGFGTFYDEETEDYLTLLTLEETPDYQKQLNTVGLDYWLRSPGHTYDTAAYISAGRHNRLYYGYPVNSQALAVRPVIKVNVKGISEEALNE